MELESLNNFVVLSQYLNCTKAAAALHITQPTLSKCMVRLEQELGRQLISRNNRGVFLTTDGQKVLKYAKQTLNQHSALLEELSIPAEQICCHLRVGFLGHSLHAYLPGFLTQYRASHPNVEIALFDGSQAFLMDAFTDGRLDVLLATEAACPSLPNCKKTLLNEEAVFMLVPTDSRYANMDCVDMREVKDETFLLLGSNYTYMEPSYNRNSLLFQLCAVHQFFPKTVPCYTLSNLPLMVACKMGLAIATSALRFYARGCVAFVPIKGHERDTYKIYAFYDDLNRANVESFTDAFQMYILSKNSTPQYGCRAL